MALEFSLRSASAFRGQHLRLKLAQAEPHRHCLAQCSPFSLTSALLGQVSAVSVVCDKCQLLVWSAETREVFK